VEFGFAEIFVPSKSFYITATDFLFEDNKKCPDGVLNFWKTKLYIPGIRR